MPRKPKQYELVIDHLTGDGPMIYYSRGHHDFETFIEAMLDYDGWIFADVWQWGQETWTPDEGPPWTIREGESCPADMRSELRHCWFQVSYDLWEHQTLYLTRYAPGPFRFPVTVWDR